MSFHVERLAQSRVGFLEREKITELDFSSRVDKTINVDIQDFEKIQSKNLHAALNKIYTVAGGKNK